MEDFSILAVRNGYATLVIFLVEGSRLYGDRLHEVVQNQLDMLKYLDTTVRYVRADGSTEEVFIEAVEDPFPLDY